MQPSGEGGGKHYWDTILNGVSKITILNDGSIIARAATKGLWIGQNWVFPETLLNLGRF